MGFWHEWKVKKAPDDVQWQLICDGAQRLFDALPGVIAQGMYKPGYKPSVLARVSQYLWRKRYAIPAQAGFPDDRVTSADKILVLPSPMDAEQTGTDPLDLSRHVHTSCCKTQAQPYDRVIGAIFLLCETHAPGCLVITSTDAELYLWRAYQKWCTEILGYKTFIPEGAPGHRPGAAARAIDRSLSSAAATPGDTSPGF